MIFSKKQIIIISSIVVFLIVITVTLVFIFSKENTDYSFVKGPSTISVNYDKEKLEKQPQGDIYLDGIKVSTVANDQFILDGCYGDKNYYFKTKIDEFEFENIIRVDCQNKTAILGSETEFMLSVLDFAKDYVKAIEYNNAEYRTEALGIIKECSSGDIACYTDKILKHFASSIKYIGDVRDEEHIEGVKKTIETGIGDCEDISIVLSSYLENIGIKTKLVMINGHAYVMACGLALEQVQKYVPEDMPFNYYPIDDQTNCYALEGTLGDDAYIGFDAGEEYEKLVIDPVTKEYSLIDSSGFYEQRDTVSRQIPFQLDDVNFFNDKYVDEALGTIGIKITDQLFSPDKKRLAFLRTKCDADDPTDCAGILYVYDIDQKSIIAKVNEPVYVSYLDLKDDDNEFEWIDNNIIRVGDPYEGALLFNINDKTLVDVSRTITSEYKKADRNNVYLRYSNDYSKALVSWYENSFAKYREYHYAVYDIKNNKEIKTWSDSAEVTNEYQDKSKYALATFSNNGNMIAFMSNDNETSNNEIYVLNLSTQEMSKVGFANTLRTDSKHGYGLSIVWADNDQYLIVYPYGEVIKVANSEKYFETDKDLDLAIDTDRTISPNGELVSTYIKIPNNLLFYNKEGFISFLRVEDFDENEIGVLYRKFVDIDGVEDKLSYQWSPSGNKLAYIFENDIYVAEFYKKDNGAIKMTRYKLTETKDNYEYVAWSNDEKKLYYVNGKMLYELIIDPTNKEFKVFVDLDKKEFEDEYIDLSSVTYKYEDPLAKSAKENFISKYAIYHTKQEGEGDLAYTALYKNEELIEDETFLINFYNEKGDFVYIRDDAFRGDTTCGDEKISEVGWSTVNNTNRYCIFYKGKPYLSNSREYVATDNYFVYQKCKEAKYMPYLDGNRCVVNSLIVNGEEIDTNTDRELGHTDFSYFDYDQNNITYTKLDGNYYVFNLTDRKLSKIETPGYDSILYAQIENGKIAYLASNYSGSQYVPVSERRKVLVYNGRKYDNVADFLLYDDDLYYINYEIEKKEKYSDVYKVSLMKNDDKINEYYIKGYSSSFNYATVFNHWPNCNSNTIICVYSDGIYTVKATEYDKYSDIEDIYRTDKYWINNTPLGLSEVFVANVIPVIENGEANSVILDLTGGAYLFDITDNKAYPIQISTGTPKFVTKIAN